MSSGSYAGSLANKKLSLNTLPTYACRLVPTAQYNLTDIYHHGSKLYSFREIFITTLLCI